MDQISMKKQNPKCRLFLKIDLYRDLAAGVYLSEAPDPLPLLPPVTQCMNTYPVLFQGGGGRSISEKVRGALVHKRGRKFQHD
jgi:hypothetical protein